jgi:hypothetical protein
MFHLFRKIRGDVLSDGSMRRYLGYALGELVLVVAGILIALQINNWNEDRIERLQIEEFAHGLIRDLELDIENAKLSRANIDRVLKKIDTLVAYTRNKSIDEMRNIDLFYLMRSPFYPLFTWNRAALDQMRNSGALQKMENQELAARISAYDALTRHLDEDFEYDRSVGTTAVAMASKVVNMNYPDLHDLIGTRERQAFAFPDSPMHRAYADVHLSLLADNVEEVISAVNAYATLADRPGLRPRLYDEMPKLIATAEELVSLLRAEFRE